MSAENKEKRTHQGKPLWIIMIPLLIVFAVGALLYLRLERELPQLAVTGDVAWIGLTKSIPFTVRDEQSGVRRIEAFISQGSKKIKVFSEEYPRQGYFSHSGPNPVEGAITIDTKALQLADGRATIFITMRDYSWWFFMQGNTVTMESPVTVDTKPPAVTAVSTPRYMTPGGAGLVVYQTQEQVGAHGVMMNDHFHPGFPVNNEDKQVFLAYVALPFDTKAMKNAYISVKDPAGNEGKVPYTVTLLKPKFKSDQVKVSDDFLNAKLPEFASHYPELNGSPLEQYLYVNNTIRKQNNQKIQELCSSPQPVQLWAGIFQRMPRTGPQAGFADHRAYFYQDKDVDQQDHLGVDLASTRNALVPAANHGLVAFADYLGIYGNTVLLDHGQGVFSLYSHLNEITVARGAELEQGEQLGTTGSTGMAGGDHLHFSMLVNGIFVNPIEWWDPHWIRVNILESLPKPGQDKKP